MDTTCPRCGLTPAMATQVNNDCWYCAPPPGEHRYLSTSCLHGHHDYCQSDNGSNNFGEQWHKTPAQCKYCDAHCICTCHQDTP